MIRPAIAAASFVLLSACASTAPDTVLLNGKIFTADDVQPWAQALAIRGDRIVAVGDASAIGALAGPVTRRIELGGRTVVPGFNDAHLHVVPSPAVHAVAVGDEPSTQQVDEALRTAAAAAPAGMPLLVQIGGRVLDDPAVTREWLDARVPDRPVRLHAFTGHGTILNSAALAWLGIDESIADPEGGRFVRDAAGRLNGRVEEYAEAMVAGRITALVPKSETTEAYRRLSDEAVRLGITSVQLMSYGRRHADSVADVVAAQSPIRWRVIRWPLNEAGQDLQDGKPHLPPQPSPRVDARGMKWMLDGSPIERLAALRQPYADRPGTSGRLNLSTQRLEEVAKWAYGSEDPLAVHAVGDGAIDAYLTALERAGSAEIWRRKRPRLEHGDMLTPDLMPRAQALGVVVVQNPAHFTLRESLLARFGPERMQAAQPMKSLVDAGIPVAIGSDGPLSPFLNIMFATLHPVRPSEALTREQAVVAYTRGSAFAELAERDKGHLSPGALADLAVLSADVFTAPPDQLPAMHSVLTLVGGRPAHDAGMWAEPR